MKYIILILFVILSNIAKANTIEFIVASTPGGPDDIITRNITKVIEENTDIQIVVINKPGAAHSIGYSYIEQTNKPTLIVSTNAILDHSVYNKVESIYNITTFRNVVLVNAQSNINSLSDLSKKSTVYFGSGGVGTFSYKAMDQLCQNMNCLHVPYKGASAALLDILSNSIDAFAIVDYGSQFISNDKYKSIGYVELKNNWVRLFSKNMSDSDKKKISDVLNKHLKL